MGNTLGEIKGHMARQVRNKVDENWETQGRLTKWHKAGDNVEDTGQQIGRRSGTQSGKPYARQSGRDSGGDRGR